MPGNEVTFKSGAYIFIEGDEDSKYIYIIKSGSIRLNRSNENIKNIRSTANPGDIIGFISSICSRPRMESATAGTDSVLITFTKESFLSLLQKKNEIAMKILSNLADELGIYNNLILNRNRNRDVLPLGMKMFNLGKSYFNRDYREIAWYIISRYMELYPDSQPVEEAGKMLEFIKNPGIKKLMEPEIAGNDRIFPENSVIFCEYEPGKELYIIREGKVKILKSDHNAEIMLAMLGEGDIFGELAIISDKPRNATAVSYSGCRLTPVNKQALIMLMNKSPDIVNRIFISLCQRIWFTFIRMEAKLYRKPITIIYAFLENKLKEDNVSIGSNTPHTFNFGIEDLFSMLELPQGKNMSTVDILLEDDNLHFNFGKTTVENPANLLANSRMLKSRDHIMEAESKKNGKFHEEIIPDILPDVAEEIVKEVRTTGITPVADKQIKHSKKEISSTENVDGIDENKEPDQRQALDIESLISKFTDSSAKTRNTAARRIGQFGEAASFAVPKLALLLNDGDKDVRITAMKAINEILTPEEAISLYTGCLNDTSCFVRSSAAKALGETPAVEEKLESVVMILSNTLSDPDPEVRANAAASLGKLGIDAHDSIPLLIAMLDDDQNVKKTAIEAISLTAGDGKHSGIALIALKDLKHHTKETSTRLIIKSAINKIKKHSKQLKKEKKKERK